MLRWLLYNYESVYRLLLSLYKVKLFNNYLLLAEKPPATMYESINNISSVMSAIMRH